MFDIDVIMIYPFISALYGVTFSSESEAAFSNYRMWESFGFIIAFAYSSFLCTSDKLYILTSFLCAGTIGFLIVEYLNYSKKGTEHDLVKKEAMMESKTTKDQNNIQLTTISKF